MKLELKYMAKFSPVFLIENLCKRRLHKLYVIIILISFLVESSKPIGIRKYKIAISLPDDLEK